MENQEPVAPKTNSTLTIALAIVLAGLMISGTILAKTYISASANKSSTANISAASTPTANITVAPITENDHILGNPHAKIFLVEYSDTECPYCKQFQTTLHQIVSDYGTDGSVAWVYRQFPLYEATPSAPALHPKAGKEAEATECAALLGGNDKFWQYIDEIFTITPSNNGLDPQKLYDVAADVGLDKTKFASCLDSGTFADKIADDYNAALAAGGTGTPYLVLLDAQTGETVPLAGGAIPYLTLKTIIQAALEKNS